MAEDEARRDVCSTFMDRLSAPVPLGWRLLAVLALGVGFPGIAAASVLWGS